MSDKDKSVKAAEDFISSFETLTEEVYRNAQNKGFWKEECETLELIRKHASPDSIEAAERTYMNQRLTLVITELIEAFEDIRKGKTRSEHIPDYSPLEEEFADAIIRIMDMAGGYKLRIAEAVIAKMEYNKGREYMHGKKF